MTYLGQLNPLRVAEAEITNPLGYNDSASILNKKKSLLKFGLNENVGTSWTTIQEFQGSEINETYVTTNAITSVISDSASNTQSVTIEGHTIDGSGNLTFATQTKTLTGTTAATLDTALARATRIYITDGTFASPATDLALSSKVYVYEGGTTTGGVPDTASQTHLIMSADASKPNNQSFKASTSISSTDYAIISDLYFDINKKTTALVDFRLEVRQIGGVWRPRFERTLNTSSTQAATFTLSPHIIIPPNSDIRITALASTTGVSVSAGFNAYLAN